MSDHEIDRQTNVAERLAVIESDSRYVAKTMGETSTDIKDIHKAVHQLVSLTSIQNERLTSLDKDIANLDRSINLKASIEEVKRLKVKIEEHDKLLQEGYTVLRALNWGIRIFGASTVGAVIYYLSTGSLPGG